MNKMAPDLQTSRFDFAWSCCALEHLGSIELGLKFIKESLKCLKPNRLAIHTTEYNLLSNNETLETGGTVLFRRKDIKSLIDELREEGHKIKFNPHPGDGYIDKYYDIPPYRGDHHLKLLIDQWVSTSIGLIIRKSDKVL